MKSLIILAIAAGSGLLIGCSKRGAALVERTRKEVATGQVVGYASTDRSTSTDIFLTVTEIWKGSEQASRLGITNGMQFSENNPAGNVPDGAIFQLSVDTNRQSSTEQIIWVRSRRVENMPIQEFKAKIGL